MRSGRCAVVDAGSATEQSITLTILQFGHTIYDVSTANKVYNSAFKVITNLISGVDMDVETAVNTARFYLKRLLPEADNLLLEEVEREEDAWLITLSMDLPGQRPTSPFDLSRTLKTFRVNAKTNEVESMKMQMIK